MQNFVTPWNAGNPPCVGWFNASREDSPDVLRYWDGTAWSAPLAIDARKEDFERVSMTSCCDGARGMRWRGVTPAFAAWFEAEMEREPLAAAA